ncbi:hypothetical protein QBC37DRAFT_377627 [Rhypophila decipiens]|uniref:Uncharacterized protein n=1 Tax=Rhypophila decipiens TaxID=261697 RepID=A0AAN6Y212_9PEZI|nr:hypothetical protein QBC37DRAFT_377627 [Rhypophila decipiens]
MTHTYWDVPRTVDDDTHSVTSTLREEESDLPPDPAPDRVFGISKHHLPERFQRHFLKNDVILFKHRIMPESIREKMEDDDTGELEAFECGYCMLDQICAWAILVLFAVASVPFGLQILSSSASISTAVIGLVATICIQVAAFILIRFSQGQVSDIEILADLESHTHPVDYLVDVFAGERWGDWLAGAVWEFDCFGFVWRELRRPDFVNGFRYDARTRLREDAPPVVDSELMYRDGMIVVRMSRYPTPLLAALSYYCIPWLGVWIDEAYQTYKYHQRLLAAGYAHNALERDGSLASGTIVPPVIKEYSIRELEKDLNGFIFYETDSLEEQNMGDDISRH